MQKKISKGKLNFSPPVIHTPNFLRHPSKGGRAVILKRWFRSRSKPVKVDISFQHRIKGSNIGWRPVNHNNSLRNCVWYWGSWSRFSPLPPLTRMIRLYLVSLSVKASATSSTSWNKVSQAWKPANPAWQRTRAVSSFMVPGHSYTMKLVSPMLWHAGFGGFSTIS